MRMRSEGWESLLFETVVDIIHGPGALTQMTTERMAQIIVLGDMAERMHETLQATVDKWTKVRHIIHADAAPYE